MRLLISTLACVACFHCVIAQYSVPVNFPDTNKYSRADFYSSIKLGLPENKYVQQRFPAKSLIFPVSLIAAGYIASKMDITLDVNEHIRKEIWTESPHKQQHIDNFLIFAPAVAVYGLNIA